MRWLVAAPGPSFSVVDLFVGWCEALRELGQHVIEFRLDERLTFYDAALFEVGPGMMRKAVTAEQATELAVNGLYSALYKTRPDVLLVISGFFVPHELLDLARHYGTRVVVLHTEEPYEHSRELALACHADVSLITDPTNIEVFREHTNAWFVPHAYRPAIHHPGPPDPALACDFGFVGTGYASRIGFLEAMDLSGLDVLLAGNWQQLAEDSPLRKHVAHDLAECLDNTQAASVYRSSRSSLNLYRREAERPELSVGWSCGPREIELAATGCFFLRDPRPEGDELFPMLPTFTSPGEASELLRWWLAHEPQRQEMAAKAREAITERTFVNNAKSLLRLLDKE